MTYSVELEAVINDVGITSIFSRATVIDGIEIMQATRRASKLPRRPDAEVSRLLWPAAQMAVATGPTFAFCLVAVDEIARP